MGARTGSPVRGSCGELRRDEPEHAHRVVVAFLITTCRSRSHCEAVVLITITPPARAEQAISGEDRERRSVTGSSLVMVGDIDGEGDPVGEYGLTVGTADLGWAGPITFGPEGILFLADNVAAKIIAVDVADPGAAAGDDPLDVDDVDVRIGSFLG